MLSQVPAPRTGVPISTSNLIRSFLEDFMDAMELKTVAGMAYQNPSEQGSEENVGPAFHHLWELSPRRRRIRAK